MELFGEGAILDLTELFVLVESYVVAAYDKREEHFDVINEIAQASCGDSLPHLAGLNGNNPIHELLKNFIVNEKYNKIVSQQNHEKALGNLIDLCPECVLTQNKKNKTPLKWY